MAKCQKCNGDGKERNYFGVITGLCPRCHGTGEAKPITNEEFLRTATTEQLADVIADFYLLGYTHGHNQMDITSRTKWTEWLKQPHTTGGMK